MPTRSIDLVIDKDEDMDLLLMFLIYNMQTIDGQKDSAVALLAAMQKEAVKHSKSTSKSMVKAINTYCVHKLYRKVLMKYKIMRVRAKISY